MFQKRPFGFQKPERSVVAKKPFGSASKKKPMQIITQTMRQSAEKFILNWRGISSEKAESQTFINEFFEIFGLYRKDYAQFEKPI